MALCNIFWKEPNEYNILHFHFDYFTSLFCNNCYLPVQLLFLVSSNGYTVLRKIEDLKKKIFSNNNHFYQSMSGHVPLSPSWELLRPVLSRDCKKSDFFTVSILKYWAQNDEDQLAQLINTQLTKINGGTPKKRPRWVEC